MITIHHAFLSDSPFLPFHELFSLFEQPRLSWDHNARELDLLGQLERAKPSQL